MRVAILGDYPLDPNCIGGGVEAVVRHLVVELKKYEDLDLHVVTLREDIQQSTICGDGNLTVHYLPATYRFANVTFFVVNKIRLLRRLAAIKPDIVHAHIAGTYAEVAHMSGLPNVLTLHGIRYREGWLKQGWFNCLVRRRLITREEKSSVRRARHIIAISPYVQEEFGSLVQACVYAIENPIPDRFFRLEDQGEANRVLYVGNLGQDKSLHHLVQSLAHLQNRMPALQLRVAGGLYKNGKSYLALLQNTVRGLALERTVHFLGHLDEEHLLEEYGRCTLLVLPSRQETAPMVIQQAMAAGKPVVATRVGGVPYLVDHGRTGLLVEYGDVQGMASAIERVLSDGTLRLRMGLTAREEAMQRFRAGEVARRTRQVYDTIMRADGWGCR